MTVTVPDIFARMLVFPCAALAAALFLTVGGHNGARAELRININEGVKNPMPIAVTDFLATDPKAKDLAIKVSEVVTDDLVSSGLFRPVDRKAFIEKIESIDVRPRFPDWRLIGAQALVTGRAQIKSDGNVRVEFRLWDVLAGQQMVGRALETRPANWRRLAHKMADAIYQRLTGEKGYFDTRIVYVSESGPKTKRVKRLAIMDQDGANHRFLTKGGALVLTPRFSPSTQEITYLAYVDNKPRVYLLNIDTGRREIVGDFPGMTFAPRFSPDGNKVIMSLETNGNTEIYIMDLRTRVTRRLTTHPGIDTSPSYSPDGKRIVFNSDRSGTQKIYVMGANGGDLARISNQKGRYATPVWSPRGDLIAFTKIDSGTFSIGVMRPDGTGERLLSQGFLVEGPTWAPNGRVLMFYRQGRGGAPVLYSIDLTGTNERRIETPLGASDPAWSPLLLD